MKQGTVTEQVTRDKVIALAESLPPEKLARWYEYGLFVQTSPLFIAEPNVSSVDTQLQIELAEWEAASDEDWLRFEQDLNEVA